METKHNPFTNEFYLTDGGLETTLIFHQGLELRHFAAFELLNSTKGKEALKHYYFPYLNLAAKRGTGFILETPTWRASADWGKKLGYAPEEIESINKVAVVFMRRLMAEHIPTAQHTLLSGNIGPRGDGYKTGLQMSMTEAQAYHIPQVKAFAIADADLVTALTINYTDEAVGILRAASSLNLPAVISFTLETDGKLPSGETLKEAIEKTDDRTDGYASHFMINCAHPNHFKESLVTDEPWKSRIRGIRANASTKSHAELDESVTLDAGDKHALAHDYMLLRKTLPNLKVVGGCCGTDHSHIEAIADMLLNT